MGRNPYTFSGNLADVIVDYFRSTIKDYVMELNDKRKSDERIAGDPLSYVTPYHKEHQIASNWAKGRFDSGNLVEIVRDKARDVKKDVELLTPQDKEYRALIEAVIEATDEQIVQALDTAKTRIGRLVRLYERTLKNFYVESNPDKIEAGQK